MALPATTVTVKPGQSVISDNELFAVLRALDRASQVVRSALANGIPTGPGPAARAVITATEVRSK